MIRFGKYLLAVTLLALVAAPALAQERRRPQRPGFEADTVSALTVLSAKDVHKELKMTDDQIAKVTAISTKQREARRDLGNLDRNELIEKMREMNQEGDKAAADILTPDQNKRFKQIRLQQKQTRAFIEEPIAKELNFNEEQKKKIKDINDEARAKRQEIIGARRTEGGGGGADSRQKLLEFNKSVDEKMLAVLNPEQQSKWKEMLGEPFKGEIPRGFSARGGERRPGSDRRDP